MNWQGYDRGMQMNEAMFVGGEGWVAKPEWMRTGEGNPGGKTSIGIDIIGLSGREWHEYLIWFDP